MKRLSVLLLSLSLVLSSCAVPPQAVSPEQDNTIVVEAPPTDPDVMYRVMAGEVLVTEGELELSAADYVLAALKSDDPSIARRAAQIAVEGQSWQYAAMAADRWVLLDPESLEARQTAIRAMILTGDYVAAEHQMASLLEWLSQDRSRAWSLISSELASANNPEEAQDVLRWLIEQYGGTDNADVLFARSQLAVREGKMAESYDYAVQALEWAPERAELQAWAGRLAVNLRRPEEALARYEKARALKPDDVTIAVQYGELLRRAGRTDEAFETLAALPDTPSTRLSRIVFASDIGEADTAAKIYREFYSANYENVSDAAFNAGQAADMLGLSSEAIDWYAKVRTGEPGRVSLLRRAVLLSEQGRLDEARNLLASVRLHQHPEFLTDSFLAESQILVDAGMERTAWELLGDAREFVPGNEQILYSRALIGVRIDELEAAELDLRAVIREHPNHAVALNALGYTLADQTDRLDEAEQLIRRAYELQPEEASIIDSMGWVAYRQGRYEQALSYLAEAWSRDKNAEIAAHLGEVLWILERREEAVQAWREGREQDPENAVLLETLDRFGVNL